MLVATTEVSAEAGQLDENERVRLWREVEALRLGCSLPTARKFALSTGNLRELERIIGKGCSPALAVKILV